MNDIQAKMYELLVKFDTLACQHGIEYYLGGGTALGAIRHQGFLPWDDDADLYITRNNYLKLLECKESFFSDDFVLVNNEEFPHYGNTLVRCVDTNSTAITKARLFDGAPKGEFLELFILDPLPDETEVRNTWLTKHWIYSELMAFAFKVANPRIEYWIDENLYKHYRERYNSEGREAVLKELEDELFTIEETEVNDYCLRWGFRNIIYPIDWFGKQRRVPFVDAELPVPSCAERVLGADYGSTWANIPSVEQQRIHSFADSPTTSYRLFVDDYSQYLDDQDLFDCYPERKKASLDVYSIQREIHARRVRIKEAHIKGVVVRSDWSSVNAESCEKELSHAFNLWREYQLSRDFWYWQICVDIDDDALAIFLEHLFVKDGFSTVKTILSWRTRERTLNKRLSNINFCACALADIYSLIDCRKFEKAHSLYNDLAKRNYPELDTLYDMRYLGILLNINCSDRDLNCESLVSSAQTLVDDFQDSGDALFLLGIVENLLGLEAERDQHLKKARAMTRNAFYLREIDKLQSISESGETHE